MKPTLPGAPRPRALQALMLAIGTALTGQAKGCDGGRARASETQAKRLAKLTGIDSAIVQGRDRDL